MIFDRRAFSDFDPSPISFNRKGNPMVGYPQGAREMIRFWLAITMILAAQTGAAIAQIPPPGGAPAFQPPAVTASPPPISPSSSITTSHGAGLLSGAAGSPQ